MAAPDEPTAVSATEALKGAAKAALITLLLCFPIVAYLTEQNSANSLSLVPRFGLVAVCAAIVGAFVLVRSLAGGGVARTLDRVASAFGGLGGMMVETAREAGEVGRETARTEAKSATNGKRWRLLGFALLGAYPFIALALAGPGGAIKWIDNFGIQILIYVMLGWGLNIVVGLAGLLDLGYVAFYAVGAYTYGLLATSAPVQATMAEWIGPSFWPLWAFWICLPVAGILAAFWGILLGFPVLRLRGDYLAIVTLAFGEIIRLVLINWVDFTGGYAGISSIPRPSLLGIPFNATPEGFAARFGLSPSPLHRLIFLYYLILGLALLTNVVATRLRRLPVGRAWEALREDEIACRALGIDTVKTKLTAFAIGAMFGGFGGAFFAARQGFISPESFNFMESAVVLAIVVLGGMGSQLGVAIAAIAMIGGTEILRELDWLKQIFGPEFDPTQYRMLLFGLAMVALMIWRPRGLIGTREPSVFLHERKAISGDLVKEGHG